MWHRAFAALSILATVVASSPAAASSLAIAYLQQSSDRYQKTIDVYTIADAAGNHFAARGEFDSNNAGSVPAMDEISPNAPCLVTTITCITATFDPRSLAWGGWYFMNGILGPTDRAPTPNWGSVPNAGYDLSGAAVLQFWARGANGGERILFFCCGVGWDPNTGAQTAPYPDSARRATNGLVTLTTTWTQYTISLTGLDLHYTLGGFGWVAAATDQPNQQPLTFYLSNIQYVKARPTDSRLLVSYETIKSNLSFDYVERNPAYVYDNSVALVGFLAAGDLTRAHTTADALLYGQQHDRFFDDGRLRNAYQGGESALPPGWLPNNRLYTARMPGWYDPGRTTWFEDEGQVSTNSGNVAWGGMALLDLWETTKEPQYLTAAKALGSWVINNAGNDSRGQGGFTGGYDGWENGAASGSAATCASGVFNQGQCKRLYKSTEHNLDLYSMFSRLYLADGDATWAVAAQQAKHFFLSMWDPQEGKFWTGTTEDGVTISKDVIPLDIQAWALQALGPEAQPYQVSLNYIESHHKTSLGYGFKQNGGNSCGDNTWFEGTAQVAVAYLLAGNTAKWQSILAAVRTAQLSSGAMPATDGGCLNTGFTLDDGSPWLYYPRAHVGATSWLYLAESGVNAFRGELYSPSLSTSTVAFPSQGVGGATGSQVVTLTNPGASPLVIRSVTFTGPNAPDFAQNDGCGASLPPGGRCAFSVTFAPTSTGSRQGTLAITETSDPAMLPVTLTVALTGTGVSPPPGTIGVAGTLPASGNSNAQSFTFQFSDLYGYQNLSVVNVLINNFLDGRLACYLAYVVSSATLVLVDDAGDAGGPYAGSVVLGNPAAVAQNSQCAVSLTSAAGSGTSLTLVVNIAFTAAFGGNKIQYLAARDAVGNNSGWQAMGVWQAPQGPLSQITVVGATPARAAAASGTAQTLALRLTDKKGAGDFGVVNVLANRFIDGRQACYLAYVASNNSLLLVDDAGDAGGPFAGNMVLNGAPGTIQNSQCLVSGLGSSAVSSGNTLTLTLNITFTSAFAGGRVVWAAARDSVGGNNTDWQAVGTLSVQ